MITNTVITIARKHVDNGAEMASSARQCLADAVEYYDDGNFAGARTWAVRSLKYSIGVFHADYKKVTRT